MLTDDDIFICENGSPEDLKVYIAALRANHDQTVIYRTRRPRQMATPRRAVKIVDRNFALLTIGKGESETTPLLVEVKVDEHGEVSFQLDDLKVFLQVIQ